MLGKVSWTMDHVSILDLHDSRRREKEMISLRARLFFESSRRLDRMRWKGKPLFVSLSTVLMRMRHSLRISMDRLEQSPPLHEIDSYRRDTMTSFRFFCVALLPDSFGHVWMSPVTRPETDSITFTSNRDDATVDIFSIGILITDQRE